MTNFYNLDAIKTSIKKDIAINSAYIDAWKNVSFPVKKDGKPFAAMSKNISGARYEPKKYLLSAGQYELTVSTFCKDAGYVSDTINASELVKYLKDESMKAKTQNYQPKQTTLEQVYTFDLEDIKNAVAARIAYLESYVDDLNKQLAKSAKVFSAFRDAYKNAMKTLETETSEFSHSDLFYAVRDCVKERYPYC